jgi:hypothetical protein
MPLKIVIATVAAMVLVGAIATACGSMKPDPNPYRFVDSRRDS